MNVPKLINIVVVDDDFNNLNFLIEILADKRYKVRRAINGAVVLRAIQASIPDLILLGIYLPDTTDYEICAQLKSNPKTQDIPVIFISALNETLDKVKAFSVGGVDYICKPFEMAEVIARIENQLSLQAAKAEIQHFNEILEARVRQRTAQLELTNQALQQEMQKRQRAQDQLLHALLNDALTKLPNLAGIMTSLNQAITHLQQHPLDTFALIVLDCDRFQLINNSLGHNAGDQVLLEISKRLKACLKPGTHLVRLGGDEFLVFLEKAQDITAVEQLAQRLQ
jgi:PleD family two-component response regulator